MTYRQFQDTTDLLLLLAEHLPVEALAQRLELGSSVVRLVCGRVCGSGATKPSLLDFERWGCRSVRWLGEGAAAEVWGDWLVEGGGRSVRRLAG